ncbi:MAG: energy-coupling factor transporter transmembrane component T [Candidatus Nanopelagicales bacterium]
MTASSWFSRRVPRPLHPVAWWVWAIGVVVAASRTTNPLVLALLLAVTTIVVVARAPGESQLKLFRLYLVVGLVIICIRMVFAMIFGLNVDGTTLFTLPSVDLPDWTTGLRFGGDVTAESLLSAFIDGLRLATLIIVLGAANCLADPRRMLRVVPGALYELGTAVVVALTIAPQLVASGVKIRRAQKLRLSSASDGRTPRLLRGLVIPVLEDSLDRSLALASSMDARGYGRWGTTRASYQRVTSFLVLLALLGVCVGAYGVLDPTSPTWLGLPMLVGGAVLAVIGVLLGRSRSRPTVYRPDPWLLPEWIVSLSGVGAALVMFFSSQIDPLNMYPSAYPLTWPNLPLGALVACALALIPAVAAPPVVTHKIKPHVAEPVPVVEPPASERISPLEDSVIDSSGVTVAEQTAETEESASVPSTLEAK